MLAETVARWLAQEGFGSFGTNIFSGVQPEEPHNVITCFDDTAPGIASAQALAWDHVGVNIVYRNGVYTVARDNAEAVHKLIAGFKGQLIPGSAEIIMVSFPTAPASSGIDDKQRHEWVAMYHLLYNSVGDAHRQ